MFFSIFISYQNDDRKDDPSDQRNQKRKHISERSLPLII